MAAECGRCRFGVAWENQTSGVLKLDAGGIPTGEWLVEPQPYTSIACHRMPETIDKRPDDWCGEFAHRHGEED